jgi:tRNA threonylcarbamoyladenosine modification (KEOPS) complex  Pcc1 subunit
MLTNAKATVYLKIKSEKQLLTLFDALTPEINTKVNRRCNVNLKQIDEFLILMFEAEDTAALRAMLNTYLRWIHSSLNILQVIENV